MSLNLDWSPLNNIPNAGEAFNKGMETGRAARMQRERQNALTGLGQGQPGALNALMQVDPQMGMQYQAKQIEQRRLDMKVQGDQRELNRDNILKGAQIIRQINPQDQAGLDQARMMAQQMGIDISQVPTEWNDQTAQYMQGLIKTADTFEPVKPQNAGPASIQEYEYAKGQGFAGTYMDFNKEKAGPIVANNGDGTFTLIPRGQAGGQTQAAPPPPPGFQIDGAEGGQASGPDTFR